MVLAVDEAESMKLARRHALAAALAEILIAVSDESGRGEHRSTVSVRLHGSATARTAIADCIEPPEHRLLEEGMMNVPPLMLSFENVYRLCLCDSARATGVMLGNKTGKRLADDEADIGRLTWVCP
jgi:hypothetical protein